MAGNTDLLQKIEMPEAHAPSSGGKKRSTVDELAPPAKRGKGEAAPPPEVVKIQYGEEDSIAHSLEYDFKYYEELIKKHNNGRLALRTDNEEYKQFPISKKHTKGTILGEIYEKRFKGGRVYVFLHVAVWMYSAGKYVEIGTDSGDVNMHHKDEARSNNEPENLQLVPHIFNLLFKRKKGKGISANRERWQYRMPLHTTFIDMKKKDKDFKVGGPFAEENLRKSPEGVALRRLGYWKGKTYNDYTQYTKKGAEKRRKKQLKAVVKFFRVHWKKVFPKWSECDELEEIFDDAAKIYD